MDAILTQLLAFPPHPPPAPPLTDGEYDKQAKNHVQHLIQAPLGKLAGNAAGGSDVLDTGSKQKSQTISEAFTPGLPLWQKVLNFMDLFDPVQIRYGGHEIRRLIEVTAQRAIMVQKPAAAIAPIRSAILRIDPSCSTFTSSHPIITQLCLTARAFAAALPVIDKDIYHFPTISDRTAVASADSLYPFLCSNHESSSTYINTSSGLTDQLEYQHHLQYYLFGAMCYIALKDWERAMVFLEVALTSPTFNTMLPLPRNVTSQAIKMYQSLSRPYTALAELFRNGIENEESAARLVAEAQAGQQVFVDESNFGLVRQVINAYRQFSVQRLEKTYAALTIAEVTRRTSDNPNDYAETGQYIVLLISAGQLNATISQLSGDPADWILRFSNASEDGPLARTEEQQYDELVRQAEKVKALIAHIKATDRKYGLSKEYIQEVKRVKKTKEAGAALEDGNSWHAPGNSLAHDEDMMADL
ncbi:MAG: hypothetical protein Q9217_002319 [Psora testacea]